MDTRSREAILINCGTGLFPHCTSGHCILLECTTLHCTALPCTTLSCTTLHYTTLYCTALQCKEMGPNRAMLSQQGNIRHTIGIPNTSHSTQHRGQITSRQMIEHTKYISYIYQNSTKQVSNDKYLWNSKLYIFNRPDVAGAVLQTPLLLIHSFNESVTLFLQIFKISLSHKP